MIGNSFILQVDDRRPPNSRPLGEDGQDRRFHRTYSLDRRDVRFIGIRHLLDGKNRRHTYMRSSPKRRPRPPGCNATNVLNRNPD